MTKHAFSWGRMWQQIEAAEARTLCTCALAGPDADGNYDLIENDACPAHGSAK